MSNTEGVVQNVSEAECHVEVDQMPYGHRSSRFPGPGVPFEFHEYEPRHSNISRTAEPNRQSFELFLKASLGRRASGVFTNFFEANDDNDYYNDKHDDKNDANTNSDPTMPQ